MVYTEILYDVADRVATITLNRPDRMNAWTPTMEAEFRAAIGAASSDDEVRAIVITGAGRGFCAGADMGRLQGRAAGGVAAAPPLSGDGNFDQRYSYLLAVPKPLIAGINGAVAGVGLCVTLYCDLRYMAAGARLSTAFARRGLIAEHGSAWMLPRLIGPMNAADLLLSGRTIDAAEAESMGLVRMLPAENFATEVRVRAAEFANLSSPRSMRIIKQQLRNAAFETLAEATRFADAEIPKCLETEDFREGVASFVEKRKPAFTGR
ncbi:MAG: enoyl-CoA hydratase [Limnobacter sp.]|nr:enoyl-CoA hydratase [Limnobacter sp.]